MDLEVREVTGNEKNKLGNRLRAYKNEMTKFEQDLVSNGDCCTTGNQLWFQYYCHSLDIQKGFKFVRPQDQQLVWTVHQFIYISPWDILQPRYDSSILKSEEKRFFLNGLFKPNILHFWWLRLRNANGDFVYNCGCGNDEKILSKNLRVIPQI